VTTPPRWQPVLYGRTRRADRWWRVRPYDVDVRWLNALMLAATGGGEGLADQPRYVLARDRAVVLVGAAARAAVLSETMNSDGSRPLYCFVGWLSKDPGATVPGLEALEALWVPWATDVYEAWMPLDWNKHPTDLADAHEPPFGRPPWTAESTLSVEPAKLAQGLELSALSAPGRPVVVPLETRAAVWRQLYDAPSDFAFVAGPRTTSADPNLVLTHLAMTADPTGTRSGDAGIRPAERAPEPTRDKPLPDEGVQPEHPAERMPEPTASGQGYASSAPDVSGWAGAVPGDPLPAPAARGRDAGSREHEPEETEERPHRKAGILRKAGEALRSLGGLVEGWPEDEADERSAEPSTPPATPASGPRKDLDYWRRAEATKAPEGRPHKSRPPPDEDC
jgi:hypothetical protein